MRYDSGDEMLIGALVMAAFAQAPRKGLELSGSVSILASDLIAFVLILHLLVALGLLVLIGGATTLFINATNAVSQSLAPDDVRGRILSVWSMIAAAVMPLGNLLLGGRASFTSHLAYVIVGGATAVLPPTSSSALSPAIRRVQVVIPTSMSRSGKYHR